MRDIVGLAEYIISLDGTKIEELKFFSNIRRFLSKEDQRSVDDYISVFSTLGREDCDVDALMDFDFSETDELLEQIGEEVTRFAIKYLDCSVALGLDGGQGEGGFVLVNVRPLADIEEVANTREYYHISKEANLQSILRDGLHVSSRYDAATSYEGRLFLFQKLPEEKELIEFGRMIQGKAKMSVFDGPGTYTGALVLFTIELPENYKVYKDEGSPYVYVTQNIPASCIKDYVILS